MTVSQTADRITYSGNGATTVWTFTFPGVSATDLAVYITDSTGTITQLATNTYSVSLTAATSTNPTGAGGSVTYPLSGSPLATGNLITIKRTIPLTQPTSLNNQGTLYPSVIEGELDILCMQTQQVSANVDRSITVAVSDDAPTALPPAAQRANLYMAFDSDGNPTAVAGSTSTNPVSSAMTPVVSAATLAAARSAMGLGTVAVENIGAGLQDNGSGSLRVIFTPAADSTNQSVTSAFHLTERHASGALTYTNAKASTLFAGFGYWVYALSGTVTIALDAADSFSGGTSGQSLAIPPGTRAWISTDGTATWYINLSDLATPGSVNNYSLSASVATNNLTVALKDRNGNDPSTASPVVISFRDPTSNTGTPSYLVITSALSIVAASGASFGTSNSTPFRLWISLFNDGGTPRLALSNNLSGTNIYPYAQFPIASSTAISAAATAAQTFYSQGAGVTSKAYVPLGYLTWETGNTLATAGVYASAPSRVQMYGFGVPLPGQPVQQQRATSSAYATGTTTIPNDNTIPQNTEGDQYLTQAITPVSSADVLRVEWQLCCAANTANEMISALFQDTTANALAVVWAGNTSVVATHVGRYEMLSATISSTTFKIRAGVSAGAGMYINGSGGAAKFNNTMISYLQSTEVMT